jgi:hypothetical protein
MLPVAVQNLLIPFEVRVVAGVVFGLLAAILPTCLYLYVEPRGRPRWGVRGDSPKTRRAPLLVRSTAWLSFAVGQLSLPWLVVPAWCAGLLWLQAKLGVARPMGIAATFSLGSMALVQSLLAFRLLPLGVRILAPDQRLGERIDRIAKTNRVAGALLLGAGALLSWGMTAAPSLVHPWLRATLVWSALRPVMAYATLFLLHALMLGRCAAVLANSGQTGR